MLLEVLTRDLKIGMYVYKLDRPWIETPFVFQGFYIETDEDIETLKQYCFYVYIDTQKETASETVVHPQRPVSRKTDENLPDVSQKYKTKTGLEKELKFARETYKKLVYDFAGVYKQIRDNHKLSFSGVKSTVKSMMRSIVRNPDALLLVTRLKLVDHYHFNHSLNCSILAASFGRYLGLKKKEIIDIGIGALLCDIGLTRLPPEIIQNIGQLNGDQLELYKCHVKYGIDMLQKTRGINQNVLDIVQFHHEQHNGKGYPGHVAGLQIPIMARMVSIVDYYQTLIAPREIEDALNTMEAINQINRCKNREFQRELVESFAQFVGIYSTGSLVELSTGEIGMVVSQHPTKKLKPKVMLVLDKDKKELSQFPVVNLDVVNSGRSGGYLTISRNVLPGEFNLDFEKYLAA